MVNRFSCPLTIPLVAAAVCADISACAAPTPAQAQANSATAAAAAAVRTPWGEPDLQGIWTDQSDVPLQRLAKYASQEFFTEARGPNWTESGRQCLLGTNRRSVAPKSTLPEPAARPSSP